MFYIINYVWLGLIIICRFWFKNSRDYLYSISVFFGMRGGLELNKSRPLLWKNANSFSQIQILFFNFPIPDAVLFKQLWHISLVYVFPNVNTRDFPSINVHQFPFVYSLNNTSSCGHCYHQFCIVMNYELSSINIEFSWFISKFKLKQ